MNDAWTALIVLLLGDPHLLEGGQRCQDGTTDPDGVFTFWWSNDLDLHRRRSKSSDFLLHTIGNTRVHGGTSRHDDVSVEIFPDVDIALHDGVEGGHVDTTGFETEDGWLEQCFWGTETLVTNGDDLTVRKFVRLLQAGGLGSLRGFSRQLD
jgi:hypothetical protein